MQSETIHLKEIYPFLGENGCDPTITTYLADNLTEMGRGMKKGPPSWSVLAAATAR